MDDIPLFFQAAAVGLFAALLPLLAARPALLKRAAHWRVSSFRPLSPNWITLWSTLVTLGGLALYAYGFPVLGIGVGVFGGVLDRIDGRSASACGQTLDTPDKWVTRRRARAGDTRLRAYGTHRYGRRFSLPVYDSGPIGRWWFEMNFPGGTDLGKVWDPFQDKVRIFAATFFFVAYGGIPLAAALMQLAPEALGTAMRRPFHLWRDSQQDSKATFIGKWKTLAQWATVVTAVLLREGWLRPQDLGCSDERYLLGNFANMATVLAAASVLSRLRYFRTGPAGNAIDALDRGFGHD